MQQETQKADMPQQCEISFSRTADDTMLIRFTGNWNIGNRLPSVDLIKKQLHHDPQVKQIAFDTQDLTAWDSTLLTFLIKLREFCAHSKIVVAKDGLPRGVQRLLEIALAVPEKTDARRDAQHEPLLSRIGTQTIEIGQSSAEAIGSLRCKETCDTSSCKLQR